MSKEKDLEGYFREAVSWDVDRAARARRSAKVAWIAAGVAALCALTSSLAIALLTPLKRVDPFVVRVDNATGIVDVVPVYSGKTEMDEIVTRYFLTHYITVCERFNFETAESDYEECGAFNAPQRNQAWQSLWATTNPNSPLNLYKNGTTVRAQVRSISFFERANGVADLVQVRYIKTERQGAGIERVSYWIATIQYVYTAPSKHLKTRHLNPLGFKIVEFRPEPEMFTEKPGAKSTTVDTTANTTEGLAP